MFGEMILSFPHVPYSFRPSFLYVYVSGQKLKCDYTFGKTLLNSIIIQAGRQHCRMWSYRILAAGPNIFPGKLVLSGNSAADRGNSAADRGLTFPVLGQILPQRRIDKIGEVVSRPPCCTRKQILRSRKFDFKRILWKLLRV